MNTQSHLMVSVVAGDKTVDTLIRDSRADIVSVFAQLDEAQRTGLATDAWNIGLRAIMNAHRQAEESRLVDIGKTLKEDLDKQLGAYVERQQSTFVQVLARYFDPRDGQVTTCLREMLEVNRRGAAKSTHGGLEFQDDVLRFVQGAVQGTPVTVDTTANAVGVRPEDAGDIKALTDIEHRIQKELERHERMRKHCEAIRDQADKLQEEVRKGNDSIELLLRLNARDKLYSLLENRRDHLSSKPQES